MPEYFFNPKNFRQITTTLLILVQTNTANNNVQQLVYHTLQVLCLLQPLERLPSSDYLQLLYLPIHPHKAYSSIAYHPKLLQILLEQKQKTPDSFFISVSCSIFSLPQHHRNSFYKFSFLSLSFLLFLHNDSSNKIFKYLPAILSTA